MKEGSYCSVLFIHFIGGGTDPDRIDDLPQATLQGKGRARDGVLLGQLSSMPWNLDLSTTHEASTEEGPLTLAEAPCFSP